MDPQPEKIGRYVILSTIGKGAMGVVYKAKDPLIGRVVAIKTVTVSGLLSAEQLEEFNARFFREAQAAGVLHHPNIVTIHDVGVEGGVPFMAMEMVEGTSLSKRLKEHGRLSAEEAAGIVQQVAAGLSFAHEHGIVHRDIKPDNILLEANTHRAVVADFGVAHVTTSELTRTGEILGTPYFMSPEQVLGNPLDGRSDLFSLGVVFYLALTGRRPFKGESVSSVCYHIVHGVPDPLPPDVRVPPALTPVLERMLAKDPAARYPDGKALVQALDAALATMRAPSPGVTEATLDLAASPVAGVPFTRTQTTAGLTGTLPGGTAAATVPAPPPPAPTASGAYAAPAASGAYGAPSASGGYGAPSGSGGYGTAAGTGAGTLAATGSQTLTAEGASSGNRSLLVAVLLLLGFVAVVVAFIVGVVLASGSSDKTPQTPAAGNPATTATPPKNPPVTPTQPSREKELKAPPTRPPRGNPKETSQVDVSAIPDTCSVTVIFETRIPAGRFQFLVDGQPVWEEPFESKRMADGRSGFRAAHTVSLQPGSVQIEAVVSGGRGDGFTLQGTRALTLSAGQSIVVGVEARRFPPPQIIIKTSGG